MQLPLVLRTTWRTSEQSQCHWSRVSAGWVSTPVKQRAGMPASPHCIKRCKFNSPNQNDALDGRKVLGKIHIFQEDFSLNWFCSIKFGCSLPSQCYHKSCKSWKRWLTLSFLYHCCFLISGHFLFLFSFLPLLKQMKQIKPKLQGKIFSHLTGES